MLRKDLTIASLSLLLGALGCQSKGYQKAGDRQNSGQEEEGEDEPAVDEESDDEEPEGDEEENADFVPRADPPDLEPEDKPEDDGPSGTEPEADPDAVKVPVTFHFSRSQAWTSEEQMRDVTAEVRRILGQAKLALEVTYTSDDEATDAIDVYFQPSVNGGGTNGISFGGRRAEILVRDDVRLGRVDDGRPEVQGLDQDEAEQARTIAHEIGHQLSLPHRQDRTNLMASGTTGWTLNDAEIDAVRRAASQRFRQQ